MVSSIQTLSRLFLVAIFLAFLVAPALDMALDLDPTPELMEKRDKARLPGPFPLAEFPAAFAAYLQDHFGFRRLLINTHNRIKVGWLRTSTVPTIAMGQDDWLFLRQEHQVEDYRRRARFSEKELAQWTRALEGRRDWLAERGIRYLFVVAPDKASIYPEKMPSWLKPPARASRFEQLQAHLEKVSDFRFIYPREAIMAQKHRGDLYFHTDSHWNYTGAYIAYQEIMRHVAKVMPDKKAHPLSAYQNTLYKHPGDLALSLGLPVFGPEPVLACTLKPKWQAKLHPGCEPPLSTSRTLGALTVTEGVEGTTGRLLSFHDSFGEYLVPHLAAHFAFSTFTWTSPKHADEFHNYVYAARPDIVIEQRVERNLNVIPEWPD